MTTSLSERYVLATVNKLPAGMQQEVRAELEVSILDAIDTEVSGGKDPSAAERDVLTDLGDPAVLAAQYSDRALHLIGPRYYLTWWRLLKLLLVIVPVCAVGGTILGQTIAGASVGEIIGQAWVVGIGSVVHVGFWVTLVFAILERTGVETGVRWDLDQLPEPHDDGTGRNSLVADVVMLTIMAVAVLWDRFRAFVVVDGEQIQIMDPGIWPWLIAFITLQGIFSFALFARRRWSTKFAIANTVIAGFFISVLITALQRNQLFNIEFVDTVQQHSGMDDNAVRIIGIVIAFIAIGVAAWSVVDGWIHAKRQRRRAA